MDISTRQPQFTGLQSRLNTQAPPRPAAATAMTSYTRTSSAQRSASQTDALRRQLKVVFDNERLVDRILANHPAETDIERLSLHVLDAQ